MEWNMVMEFIPIPNFFYELNTLKVSSPILNQFWEEYRDGVCINYEYTFPGYSNEHNQEFNCFKSAQYCYYINSPYYTYKHLDEFDYRFAFAGFSPFYADYNSQTAKIIFDASKPRPKLWTKYSAEYQAISKIRF